MFVPKPEWPAPFGGVETVKMYVTKYALTAGIEEVEIDKDGQNQRGLGYLYGPPPYRAQYRLKLNIFDNREDAVKAAEDVRVRKIASLRKSIAKLEKLKLA